MNTLKNYMILYDEECPMCRSYTRLFVSSGILEEKGRAPYQHMEGLACPMVDKQRAVNEIALINLETGEVTYGIRSFFKIFGAAIPFLKPLFNFAPFVWTMSKVYSFISSNRRVMMPAPLDGNLLHLQPTFKLGHRILYLIVTWAFTAFILASYTHLMDGLLPPGNFLREYVVCGGQILFQGIVIQFISKHKRWDYLGNMMSISFAGALLLLPCLLLSAFWMLPPVFYAAYFMCVAGLMFLEHIRRSYILKLGWSMTVSWVVYRLMVLLFILS